jgi:hypothetical protein
MADASFCGKHLNRFDFVCYAIVVRDWQTKVPRFIGDTLDGTNI